MPWTVKDVDEHKKGLSDAQKKVWVKVANSALKRCQEKGGEDCEASAIRQANTVAGNIKENAARGYFTSGEATVEINALDVGGEKVTIGDLVSAYLEAVTDEPDGDQDLGEAMKTVDGEKFPSTDFLVVDDQAKPSTWHLQVKRHGKVDRRLMGGAKAALTSPGGHRGQKYDGPDKAGAVKKLKALYKSEDMEWSESAFAEANVGKVRDLLQQAIGLLETEPEPEMQAATAEAEFSESASLDAIAEGDYSAIVTDVVKEAGITAGKGRRSPVVVDLQIIKPGPGNKRQNRYYPAPMLKTYAHVFEGSDIFITDHDPKQRGEKTKVGRIRQCPVRFTDAGAPIGRTIVYDPDMAEKIRNRADEGELHTLECSILGMGNTRPGKVDGKPYDIVETINPGPLVEFVSKAGAGGHAIALAENITGGVKIMDKEQVKRLLSESSLPQDVQERLAGVEYVDEGAVKAAILAEAKAGTGGTPCPTTLAEAEVKKVLEATKLPHQAQKRLAEGQYLDAEALQKAVEQETVYVKELTGSGKPFGHGAAPSSATVMSEADFDAAYNDIMKRHGLNVPEEVR